MRFSPAVPKLSLLNLTSCPLTASFLLQVRKQSQDSEDTCSRSCIKLVTEPSLEPKSLTPSAAHDVPLGLRAETHSGLRTEEKVVLCAFGYAQGLVIHAKLMPSSMTAAWLAQRQTSRCLINWIHLWALYLIISIGMESRCWS